MITTHATSTKQLILVHLRKRGQSSALELASLLEISPQAIRRHLKDLESEGLITYASTVMGMGRPQHRYQLSPSGQEQFPANYDEFAVGLLSSLSETLDTDQMGAILRKQWERKAVDYRQQLGSNPLPERLSLLVHLRQAEGYMAEWQPDPSQPHQFILIENNCAIAQVAHSFPSVCGHELEMFAATLPDCQVERITWLVEGKGHCGYLIKPLGVAQTT